MFSNLAATSHDAYLAIEWREKTSLTYSVAFTITAKRMSGFAEPFH